MAERSLKFTLIAIPSNFRYNAIFTNIEHC